ncbi:heparinase II/III family protein [Novosphingobium sp. ZW T3_23]|uniref:heparinase II/III domain-containing protein n=1 Tax=Novosphingobium sp. ZW T3_23 TaxID=3378084 RepID=UPI0038554D9C
MNAYQLLTAVRRIPVTVLAHQVRRKARDTIVPLTAGAYRRRMESAADRFPEISESRCVPADLADFVARYYRSSLHDCQEAAHGKFDLMGTTVDFGSVSAIDWRHRLPSEHDHNLWRMKLCQLEIVHSLLADGRAADASTALALIESFERAIGFDLPDPFRTIWSPYGASHRILATLSGFALARSRGTLGPELGDRIARLLHRDAAFVRANVEHDLCNNHTERNLAALCLYGMACVPFSARQSRKLDREVRTIIEQTILPDGMQIERSAMYQGFSVMALRIFAAADFLSPATRALARERGAAAESAWLLMSHRDGDIALFNDSWIGETPRACDVLEQTHPRREQSILPDAGYIRLESGEIDVWMDAGAIGPEWNPGHGHADFLGIEVDVAGERLIVDPGTSQYSTGPRRAWERSAAAHNGPCFARLEPVEYFGCFKVGRIAAAEIVQLEPFERAVGGRLATRHGTLRRSISSPGKGTLLVSDNWIGLDDDCVSRFLVPADWDVKIDKAGGIRLSKGAAEAHLEAVCGRIVLDGTDMWSRRYMAPEPAHVLSLIPERSDAGHYATLRVVRIPPVTMPATQDDRIPVSSGEDRR